MHKQTLLHSDGPAETCSNRLQLAMASGIHLVAVFVLLNTAASDSLLSSEPEIQFARDIRPLLASKCFACHGPDEAMREVGLRLDEPVSATQPTDSGLTAILPGRAAESELMERVTTADADLRMPPDGRLSEAEVNLLRDWINQGARYQEHWAFQPPVRPALPVVQAAHWPRTAIDYFILSKLEAEGLGPAPVADRATLVRRLYLDLLGLLPSTSAVQAFIEDSQPMAYERLVDELLASPHFGERWGRYWLDLARYGDSDGYLDDRLRPNAWVYRDWVINAINRDLPFDEFTIEQLAGDLLPNATVEQKIATGFHRNTLRNTEAGVDREEYRVKEVVDRVSTTGVVWLGLTLGCAECHTHKYDPITQLEFFKLYAIFNNAQETDLPATQARELVAQALAMEEWQQGNARLARQLRKLASTAKQRQSTWEEEIRKRPIPAVDQPRVAWRPLFAAQLKLAESTSASLLEIDELGVIEASGAEADTETYRLEFELSAGFSSVAAVRLELLPGATSAEDLLPAALGRAASGSFLLTDFRVGARSADRLSSASVGATANSSDSEKSASPEVIWHTVASSDATLQPAGYEVARAHDGNKTTGWSSREQVMGQQVAVFNLKQPLDFRQATSPSRLVIELEHAVKQAGTLRRFRLSVHPNSQASADTFSEELASLLAVPKEHLSALERQQLSALFARGDSVTVEAWETLFKHAQRKPRLPSTKAPVFSELKSPRETYIHIRGEYKRPGELAAPQVLHSLHPGHSTVENANRLDLAYWLVDPRNPLPARVTLNYWWSRLFGRGIVSTPDDFGARGSPPSHPELLDWLAVELIRGGWSRKQIIRQLVTSATYRQSSRTTDLLQAVDPLNQLLGRQSRLRLEAEIIRDITLQAGGLLQAEIGGPSILPPLPDYITGISRNREWPLSSLADRHKRGLYILLRRATPYPMLTTFDAPDSSLTCAVRERSNTPLQSLSLLNDKVFFTCAQGLGARLATECDGLEARLDLAMRVCLGRSATPEEMPHLRQLVDEFRVLLSDDPMAAEQIIGDTPPATSLPLNEQAALVLLSRVLMNLDSFFCRE